MILLVFLGFVFLVWFVGRKYVDSMMAKHIEYYCRCRVTAVMPLAIPEVPSRALALAYERTFCRPLLGR